MGTLAKDAATSGAGRARIAGDVAVAGVWALLALLFINNRGPGFSWDSNVYLVLAEQLTHGNLNRQVEYAPLMPWMLGLLELVLRDAMLAINAYMLLVWTALFYLFRAVLRTGPIATGLVFVFLFANPASAQQITFVLTEPLYAVLLLAAVVALGWPAFGQPESAGFFSRHREAFFLVAIALLPLQRYIGGFLAVYLGLVYLLGAQDLKAVQTRLAGLVAAAIPFAFVLFWNYLVTDHFSGYRGEPLLGFGANLGLLWQVLWSQYPFETFVYLLAAGLLIAQTLRGRDRRPRRATVALVLVYLVPLAQLAAQLESSSRVLMDAINPRYVIVILPIVAAMALRAAAPGLARLSARMPGGLSLAEPVWFVAAVALALVHGFPRDEFSDGLHTAESQPELAALVASPGLLRVAVVDRNERHMFASDILTGSMTDDLRCSDYTVKGSSDSPDFEFVPACDRTMFPVFVPLAFDTWEALPDDIDALVLRNWGDEYEPSAAAMTGTAPACARVETASLDRPVSIVFFDLRGCPD